MSKAREWKNVSVIVHNDWEHRYTPQDQISLIREVLPDEVSDYVMLEHRIKGWSDVLKLILTKGAQRYINQDAYCSVEFRDWLESELHKLQAAMQKEGK